MRRSRIGGAVMVTFVASSGCLSSGAGYDLARDRVRERTTFEVPADDEAAQLRASILKEPLTADGASRLALANSAQLDVVLSGVGIARADAIRALALPNPHAGVGLFIHTDGRVDLDLDATIDLLDWLLLPARGGSASDRLDAAALEAAAALLELAHQARIAFFDYQAAAQILELRKTVTYAAAQSAEIAAKLLEAGNVPELEALNERALYEETRLALGRAEVDATVKRERLNAATGLHGLVGASWTMESRMADPTPFDEAKLEGRAVGASLELQALRLRHGAASVQADLAWAEGFLPGLEVGVGVERENLEGEWGIGPRFGIGLPIFYQGQGQVALAEADMRRASGAAVVTATRIRSAARALSAQLSGARESAEFYRRNLLPLRERIVDETLKQYNAMNTGPVQVLQAKRDQIETARAYVEVLRDYWITRSQIELLLAGGLPGMPAGALGPEPPMGGGGESDH